MESPHDLVRIEPQTPLERMEDWAALSPGDRKRRAAEALRDDDIEALEGLLEAYLRLHGRRGLRVSDHTLRSYRRGLRSLAEFAQGSGRKLHQLTHEDGLRFARHQEDAGVSAGTVNVRLAAARAVCRALQWADMMPKEQNPFAQVGVADPTPAHEKRQHFRSDEVERLLAVCRTPRERAFVLLGADAGLRVAEVAALTWEAVDLPAADLQVRSGKGGRTQTVVLTPRCAAALDALEDKHAGPIFGVSSRRIQALFARLCELAGVRRLGFHALRHSAGTRLYESTRDLHVVARHLRHATLDTTRVYAHLADSDYRKAVQVLAETNSNH